MNLHASRVGERFAGSRSCIAKQALLYRNGRVQDIHVKKPAGQRQAGFLNFDKDLEAEGDANAEVGYIADRALEFCTARDGRGECIGCTDTIQSAVVRFGIAEVA